MTNPSPQQLAIRAFLEQQPNRSLTVEAVAGSGKTSTIVWLAREVIPRHQVSLFLAFNKAIADELKERLPYHIRACTFHSFCSSALTAAGIKAKVDDKKCKWILKDVVPDWTTRREIEDDTLRAIGYAKAFGTGVLPGAPSVSAILSDYGLDCEANTVQEILDRSRSERHRIDFDDMLYGALDWNVALPKAHNIFVDEAQDTNAVQAALLQRMLFPGGRVVLVGDSRQAIYGFRGADTSALENLTRLFAAERLPLSVSWRCSRAVVAEARKFIENPKQQTRRGKTLENLNRQLTPVWDDYLLK